MHLYFITRGIKQQRDLFVKFMETQMFKWTRKNLKTGKMETVQVQGALRPVELWEFVFPEECYDEVCTMLEIDQTHYETKELKKNRKLGMDNYKKVVLRKMLGNGVKPLPKYNKVPTNKYIEKHGIALYPIGVKKDEKKKMEAWGFEQEML